MPLDLTQLRKLHENATPGQWEWEDDWTDIDAGARPKYADLRLTGFNDRTVIPLSIDHYDMELRGPVSPADRALIAYVRTHLPEIIERLERIK